MLEFPDFSQHLNTSAYGLDLTDMKSVMLNSLMWQIGLQQPERFVWTLRQAYLPPGGVCPLDEEFEVVQRNYDIGFSPPNQYQFSSYINDELYTFYIFFWDSPPTAPCAIPAGNGNDQFRTVPYPVNPFDHLFSTVASGDVEVGTFYSGLTRDDLAGLRSLLSTNNVIDENAPQGSNLIVTNGQQVLITSNLFTLFSFAQTNDPSVTAGTFGVSVTGTNIFFTTVTNWSFSFQQALGKPLGTEVLVSNATVFNFVENFSDTFGNIITNGNTTNTPLIVQDCNNNLVLNYTPTTREQIQTTTQQFGEPGGTTNVSIQTITLPITSGEYITVPPGQCGWEILCTNPLVNVVAITNVIGTAAITTNGVTSTFNQVTVTYFTNHQYIVRAIDCNGAAPAGLYQGIGKVRFIEADYDSVLGQFFQPITNYYSKEFINANDQLVTENFQRIVTAPDWLIQAADISAALPFYNSTAMNTPNFVHDPGRAALAGPGTINPPVDFTYNKYGNLYLNGSLVTYGLNTNSYNPFNEDTETEEGILWGSFDASTNPPDVYPSGNSIENLENEVLVNISPAPSDLPDGTNGVPYGPITFTASGGGFNYTSTTWQIVNAALPAGLTLSNGGVLSGTPRQTGTFDFTVQMTDYNGRTVTWLYTITIH